MYFLGVILSCLALTSSVNAQGIDMHMVLSKQPKLSSARNSRTTSTNTKLLVSSILSRLDSIRPTIYDVSSVKSIAHSSSIKATSTVKKTTTTSIKKTTIPSTKRATTPPVKQTSTKKTSIKRTKTTKTTTKKTSSSKKHTTTTKKALKGSQATSKVVHHLRDLACAPSPILYGYQPTPNTPAGFFQDNILGGIGLSLTGYGPGYTTAFLNGLGSAISPGYITYIQLSTYNNSACAAACTAMTGCQSYNIYFERNPTLIPGPNCTNPAAATVVKCSFWSSNINSTMAVNIGEWRSNFTVLISGSSGFNKQPEMNSILSGYGSAIPLAGAINLANGASSFVNNGYFPGPFNPALCSPLCQQQNANNQVNALINNQTSFAACNYINALALSLNGVVQGTYCQLYTTDVSSQSGLYTTTMNNVTYDLLQSYGFASIQPISGSLVSVIAASNAAASSSAAAAAGTNTAAAQAPLPSSAISCPANHLKTYQPIGTPNVYKIYCYSDYFGNDYGSITPVTFQQCLDNCAKYAACVAVSYSGVACYMKQAVSNPNFNGLVWGASLIATNATVTQATSSVSSASSTATPSLSIGCPASNNTYYVPTSVAGKEFRVGCGLDFSGTVIATNNASTLQSCLESCAQTAGCVTSVISGATCYLKNQVGFSGSIAYDTNMGSGRLVDPSSLQLINANGTVAINPQTPVIVTGSTYSDPNVGCPTYNNTYWSDATNSKLYSISCGSDISGAVLTSNASNSVASCLQWCSTYGPSCLSGIYVSGSCYLKGVGTTLVSCPACTAGRQVDSNHNLVQPAASSSTSTSTTITTTTGATAPSQMPVAVYSSTAITCPYYNNTYYSSSTSSNTTWAVSCGMDWRGPDLTSNTASTLSGCFDLCAAYTGCYSVSYAGTACYMKGFSSTFSANSGVYGGRRVDPSSFQLIGGTTTTTTTTASSTTASSSTTSSPSIAPLSITSDVGASCPGYNNTYWKASGGQTYLIGCSQDMTGPDVGNNATTSLGACFSLCANTTGCYSVSYLGQNMCYMKGYSSGYTTNTNVWGGRLVNNSTFQFINPSASSTTTTSSSTTASSSSTTVTPPTTYAAPVVGTDGITTVAYPTCSTTNTNTYAFTDSARIAYLYMCGGGSAGSAYNSTPVASNSWRDCFGVCDTDPSCNGFSYVNGAINGEGSGNCWLKNANPMSFASTANLVATRIGAYKRPISTGS